MLFLKKKLLVLFLVINVFIIVGVSSKIENNNYATQSNEIDEYIDLEELNTDDLIVLIVDNELDYIKLFSSVELGIEKFKVNNKYYGELSNREDANECLENMIARNIKTHEAMFLLNILEGNYHLNETIQGTRDYIYAPNGTVINYAVYKNNSIQPSQYESYHSEIVEEFPSLVNSCISPANDAYNCHSYAWYMQNASSNHYWIAYPTSYLNDDSYYEVANVQYGDILCYYAVGYHPINNNTLVYGPYISHSAIIVDDNNFDITDNDTLSNVDLISKWGECGVYEHNGDECPYGNRDTEFQYVKAYRPKTNYSCTLSLYGSTINKTFNTASPETNIHKYEMYELNVNYAKNYQITVSSSYSLNVRLYDCHMQAIINNPTNTYNDGTYSVIINPSLTIGIYYLRVCYQNLSNNGIIHTNIVCHNHSYTYTWVSYIQHRQSCVCGVTGLQAHIVSPDAYNSGQMYATCLLCGGNALVNNYNKSQNIYPSTINGSFMLPNGVIVIVEEDIEAYIEGTLVFNYLTSQTMYNSIGSIFRQKCIY